MSGATRRRLGIGLRILVVAAVVVLGYRFARRIEWAPLWRLARGAEPVRLAAVALLCVLIAPLKALRTRLLIAPFADVPLSRLTYWNLASWAADNLLMSQAGFGLRVALLRSANVPLLLATSQQILEKLIEGVGLLVLLLPLSHGWLLPDAWTGWMREPAVWIAIGVGLLMLIGIALWLARRPRFAHALHNVAEAAVALRRPRTALLVIALTALHWAVEVAMLALTLAALRLPLTLPECARGVLAVNLAGLVPGLPANLGTFEAAATAALISSGVDSGSALGVALLFHALHTLPVTALGISTLRKIRARTPVEAAR